MGRAAVWLVAVVATLAAVATGLLPLPDAVSTMATLAPVLVFLVGITVVAEVAGRSGLFDVAAYHAARGGRHRVLTLWLLTAALATVTTVVLSLDTTAVLLTPVVLTLAQRLGLAPVPFAMLTVWLANTASLLLPVSNLTNLLAQHRADLPTVAYARQMWLPALAAVVVTVLVLSLVYRRSLRGRYDAPRRPVVTDRVLLAASTLACAALAGLPVAGVPVAWTAAGCALGLLVLALARAGRQVLTSSLVPWRLVLAVSALFLVVAAARAHGLDEAVAAVAGTGTGSAALVQLTAVGAGLANLVNNLPAYAVLAPLADDGLRPYALLLGVDLGPLVLLWGSLATLLWRERCRAAAVSVGWREFAAVGLAGVPLVLTAASAALLLAS